MIAIVKIVCITDAKGFTYLQSKACSLTLQIWLYIEFYLGKNSKRYFEASLVD